MIRTISLLEFVWLIAGMVAAYLSVRSIRDAMLDSSVLAAAGVNGPRRVAASNNIQQEIIRFVMVCLMVFTATFSAFLPEIEPAAGTPTYANDLGLIMGIFLTGLLGLGTALDRGMRRAVNQTAPVSVQLSVATVNGPSPDPAAKDQVKAAIDVADQIRAGDVPNGGSNAAGSVVLTDPKP